MANRRYIDFPIASSVGDSDIILIWQSGANKQTTKATFLSGLPENLDELNDVAISGLTNGQILRYDSVTGKWENTDQGNLDLNDLNDVQIVSPSNGQVLVYNSSTGKWENSSGGFVPYTGAVTTVNLGSQTIQAGQFVKVGGTAAQFLKANGSVDSTAYGTGSVTSVALSMPTAFSVAGSPITTAGTLAVTGAGTVGQYIRGDGSLADFPESSGGGSSISYYLNGSVSQGTIGGVAYRELNKVPILGAGTDFTIVADGYIASFITDAGDPNLLEIPGGNWNFETYFSSSSSGGSPTFYVELYKVSAGGTATLIASNSAFPELIAFGTNIISYFSTLAVPTTALALTDRLAVRYYVTHSGRTITLHTENGHLCQIITTFTTGITALNGLTAQVQNFAVGTSGTDFAIASATATHTFNLPTASATNRGALSSADWSTFNAKENAITAGTTAQYFRGDKTFQTLNTAAVPELTNLYYTEARVNANTNVAANTAARHNAVTLGTANGLSLSTQVLSLGLASAGVTGALSGTDWTTFNGKQNALTNPVTGTGASGRVAYWNGTNSITSDSDLLFDGSNVTVGGNIVLTNGANRFVRIGSFTNYNYDLQTTNEDFQIIEAGATPRLTIKYPNGNVLIGTTIDSGFKFDVSGTARISDGTQGLIIRAYTGTDGWGAIYPVGVTPNTTNYTLIAKSTNAVLNASTSVTLAVADSGKLTANSTGISVIGTATISSTLTSAGVISSSTVRPSSNFAADLGTSSIRWAEIFGFSLNVTSTITSTLSSGIFLNNSSGGTNATQIRINNTSGDLRLGIESSTGGTIQLGTLAYAAVFGNQANNAVQFTTNGTARMIILGSGNVGIGTTSPASERKLTVVGGAQFTFASNSGASFNIIPAANGQDGADFNLSYYTGSAYGPLNFIVGESNRLRINPNGNVLLGTTTDFGYRLTVNGNIYLPSGGNREIYMGSATSYNYRIRSTNDDFIISEAGSVDRLKYVYADTRWYITGGLTISGSLSKGSGSFKIEHPLPEKKDTHHLVHSFIEGPQADNIYRGKVNLVNGFAEVNIDESANMTNGTFVLLNGNVQCFTSNESGYIAINGKVDGNILKIQAADSKCNDTISWLVIGERIDQHMKDTNWTDTNGKVIVEPLKN